jgi:hypothetical protein
MSSLLCLTTESVSNIVSNGSNYYYTFNGETTYNSSRTYGLYNGTYTLKNISESHPMAILNNDVSNSITYSPNNITPITIYVYSPGIYDDGYYKFATSTGEIDILNDFLFMRNKTYIFEASGEFTSHPFRIYHNNSYTSAISQNGEQLLFTIQSEQDSNIYYQCTNHINDMSGNLTLSTKTLTGTTSDGTYDFYYGDVDVNIAGDFNEVSVYCYYHNYMGGENLLQYSTDCNTTSNTCDVASFYNSGTLFINNQPFKSIDSSLYLNNKKSTCNVISSNGKHNSYERYLLKKKNSM